MRFRGSKWLNEATYISDEDKARVIEMVKCCKASWPGADYVGVRPPSYTGEPHPVATVVYSYRGGESIFNFVYKAGE